jgi:hypothetical protein
MAWMSKELPGLLFLLAGCTRRKTLRRIWVPQVPVFARRDFDADVFYVNAPPILDFAYNFSVGTARALLKGQSIAQTNQRSHLRKPLKPYLRHHTKLRPPPAPRHPTKNPRQRHPRHPHEVGFIKAEILDSTSLQHCPRENQFLPLIHKYIYSNQTFPLTRYRYLL